MTSTATETITVTTTTTALTLADTCDACGYSADTSPDGQVRHSAISRAYVRVTMPDGKDMLFCGHHYATYELALTAVGATLTEDRRAELTVKPGYSA